MRIRSSSRETKNFELPGVALAARAAPELVVDAPALVTLGADHVEAAGGDDLFPLRLHLGADPLDHGVALGLVRDVLGFLAHAHLEVAAELDVGAAARHVGGDGDAAHPSGLGDDDRFVFVVAGVEDVVGDLPLLQQTGKMLGLLDADGAHQQGLPAAVRLFDLLDHGGVFLGPRAIDLVVAVVPNHRHVGRDFGDRELVDLGELAGLRHRRAGHARELGIEAEVVLEGDRGEGLVFLLDVDPLLGLERLVQPLGVAPALHHAPGELVDDDHPSVLDDVVGCRPGTACGRAAPG